MTPRHPSTTLPSLLLAAIAIVLPASASSAEPTDDPGIEIPTQLINVPTVGDLDGSCSFCRVFPLATTESKPNEATLELYYEDDSTAVVADIEVILLLDTDEYRTLTIEDVQLETEHTFSFTLNDDPEWSWEATRHAWVEVVPTEPVDVQQ